VANSFGGGIGCVSCRCGDFSSRPIRAQGEGKTLRQVLAAENVTLDAAALHNLDKTITSGAELNDAAQFAVAYYVSDATGELTPPMFVDVYDRRAKKWKSGTIEAASAKSEGTDVDCFGSVLSISAVGDYFTFETHINPSAGCEIILSRDLKLKTSLYGWTLGHFGDGGIIFHRSQIHFATVHPAEVAFYDPATGKEFAVFPRKPFQQVRLQLTESLREFFKTQQDYCQKANDPCDPEYFDSSIEGKVATDDREHAAAFVVSYEQQGFRQDEKKPGGPAQVVYVYRRVNDEAKIEYREMLWSDVKAKVGEVALEKLVEPAMLEKIFGGQLK
jgi:hypothetical protein